MNEAKELWEESKKIYEVKDKVVLGDYYSSSVRYDIKHFMMILSRYKFVSKLLLYKKDIRILELGCSEGLGGVFFSQNGNLKEYVGIDFDQDAIQSAIENFGRMPGVQFYNADFMNEKIEKEKFDCCVSLDVIEHINKAEEKKFVSIISDKLKNGGTAIIGTPNITMYPYQSEAGKIGHVNMYTQQRLYELLSMQFKNVFIFNMTDEVVHTGFNPMSCYIFAVCTEKRKGNVVDGRL